MTIKVNQKEKGENICKLNRRNKETNIQQQAQAAYLGCILDESMSSEPTSLKFINKIIEKLKFNMRTS